MFFKRFCPRQTRFANDRWPKVSTVHEPCLVAPVVVSISNVCDDIMVCFCGL